MISAKTEPLTVPKGEWPHVHVKPLIGPKVKQKRALRLKQPPQIKGAMKACNEAVDFEDKEKPNPKAIYFTTGIASIARRSIFLTKHATIMRYYIANQIEVEDKKLRSASAENKKPLQPEIQDKYRRVNRCQSTSIAAAKCNKARKT